MIDLSKHTIDKSKFSAGPWMEEPDYLYFSHAIEGNIYRCHIIRVGHLGHLCGYVEIDKCHPLYQKDADKLYDAGIEEITFTDYLFCDKDMPYVIGFDCAHSWDMAPYSKELHWEYATYKDISHVTYKLKDLCKQIEACNHE